MRYSFTNDTEAPIDKQIEAVLESMTVMTVEGEEYPKLLSYLERLHELKAKNKPERLSRETMAMVTGNLLGILLIVAYEQHHVITSKAINQIGRLRT